MSSSVAFCLRLAFGTARQQTSTTNNDDDDDDDDNNNNNNNIDIDNTDSKNTQNKLKHKLTITKHAKQPNRA